MVRKHSLGSYQTNSGYRALPNHRVYPVAPPCQGTKPAGQGALPVALFEHGAQPAGSPNHRAHSKAFSPDFRV